MANDELAERMTYAAPLSR